MSKHAEIEYQPGEYELLRTKAECGWWDSGTLLLTNYRLLWFPGKLSSHPRLEIDLQSVAACDQVRSIKSLFLQPSLRLTMKNGSTQELHNIKGITEVHRQLLQHLHRERYQPGSLFRE